MKDLKRVASLFIVGIRDLQYNNELHSFLKEFPVSGLALFNSPYDSPQNIWNDRKACLEQLYEFLMKSIDSKTFIAADQEGGRVRRLRGPFVALPSAEKLSKAYKEKKDIKSFESLFRVVAKQLHLGGITLNFAPVCDLRTKESHEVIGDRSFGSTLEEVFPLIECYCKAFEGEDVHTTLKHFPGHGPTRMDSHEKTAVLFKDEKELEKSDLKVFEKFAEISSAIMTAHIAFPEQPEKILSLDAPFLRKWKKALPKRLAWITDDIQTMKAVSDKKPWLKGFDAPYDFLLLCGSLQGASQAIEETIHYAERSISSFEAEMDLEKRLERSSSFFQEQSPPEKFSLWRQKILDLEKEAGKYLEKLSLI